MPMLQHKGSIDQRRYFALSYEIMPCYLGPAEKRKKYTTTGSA